LTASTINSPENQDLIIQPDSGKTKVVGDFIVSDNIITDSLTVTKSVATTALLVMEKTTTTDIEIKGHIIGSEDNRGTVTVLAGDTEAEYVFEKEYINTPSVVASPITKSVLYHLDITKLGFSIIIDEPQEEDIIFNWIAVE